MPGQIASKGNFLYVRFLLDSLGKGLASTDEMSALPAELDGLYLEFFNRAVKAGGKNWQSDYAPLIGTLSVAEGGLTIQQLRNFTATARVRGATRTRRHAAILARKPNLSPLSRVGTRVSFGASVSPWGGSLSEIRLPS